jgi:hypothetical protein
MRIERDGIPVTAQAVAAPMNVCWEDVREKAVDSRWPFPSKMIAYGTCSVMEAAA